MKIKRKVALITGITGQDGSLMAEYLLKKGYIVHGIKRRTSTLNATERLDRIYQDKFTKNKRLYLHYGDVTDALSCLKIISEIKPDEIYHFAAQSHVAISFEMPVYTTTVDSLRLPIGLVPVVLLFGGSFLLGFVMFSWPPAGDKGRSSGLFFPLSHRGSPARRWPPDASPQSCLPGARWTGDG